MKKQRKLIGVIAGLVDAKAQSEIMKGLCEVAFQNNYDIAVFSILIKQFAREMYQTGEINIYNLINYELFDGIIMIPDTIRIPGLVKHITSELKEKFVGPVISLDYHIDGFINIEYDDVTSMEALTDHLIEVHHFTNIACMTGPKEHPHAIRRLNGYKNSLKKHNIDVNEDQIYYGDFWYDEGERVVEHMVNSLSQLPQAVVCTCDVMAISVCEALKKYHIKVPRDIAVVGFDEKKNGIYYKPAITTMRHKSFGLGKYAMTHMIEALEQKPFSKPMDIDSSFLPYESCGCKFDDVGIDYKLLSLLDEDYTDSFYSAYNYMIEELLSADTLQILSERICEHTRQFNEYDKFFIALCDNWDYVGFSEETSQNYITSNYTNKMHLQIAKEGTRNSFSQEAFPSSIMLPEIWSEREKPSVFYFNPIHFNDRCYGYCVLTYKKPSTIGRYHRDWLRIVGMALESLRVKNNFKYSNQQLEEYAQIDSLTKIYNRNALAKYSEMFYQRALQEQKVLLILMGDLNCLKFINDNYGHIEGDNAIQLCAVAFQRICTQNEKCFRYGGDEFILFGLGNYSLEQVKHFENEIHTYLQTYNESSDKPYEVKISLGYWYGQVDEQHTLSDYIKMTDQAMLAMKQKYRREKHWETT